MPPKYPYPYVDCETHGKQLGYCVCVHIAMGVPIWQYIRASEEETGEALCEECHINKQELDINDLIMMCAIHLAQFMVRDISTKVQ